MVDHSPLYNSFLTKTYVEYLRHHHPQIDLQSVLNDAGMSLYQVEDPAHWFTQDAVDRFHESIVRHTGDADLPRKVGRYTAYARAGGALRQYMLGLMTPAGIYHLMEKNYPLLSRGASIQVKRIGARRVEITATPKPGVAEKPYQCANRTGIFETFPALFTNETGDTIDHPECFHRGHPCCRYIVTWGESHPLRWRRLRNITLFAGAPGRRGDLWLFAVPRLGGHERGDVRRGRVLRLLVRAAGKRDPGQDHRGPAQGRRRDLARK
jgi:hypothetical protein